MGRGAATSTNPRRLSPPAEPTTSTTPNEMLQSGGLHYAAAMNRGYAFARYDIGCGSAYKLIPLSRAYKTYRLDVPRRSISPRTRGRRLGGFGFLAARLAAPDLRSLRSLEQRPDRTR